MKESKNAKNFIFLTKPKQFYGLIIIRFFLSVFGLIASIYMLVQFEKDGVPRQWEILLLTFLAIIILTLHIIDKRYFPIIKNGVPILRHDIKNKEVKSKTDLFSEGIIPTNPNKTSLFNVHVELDDSTGPLVMCIYKTKENYLVGEAFTVLDPRRMHNMGLLIKPEEKFNFQFDKAGIVKKLSITEIYAP